MYNMNFLELQNLAEFGNPEAQYELGAAYIRGDLIEHDFSKRFIGLKRQHLLVFPMLCTI